MRAHWILLHAFAVVLWCDYGMFSTLSPSPSSRSVTEVSNVSDSNASLTTAQYTTENVTDSEDDELSGNWSLDNESTEAKTAENGTQISTTVRPESTTGHEATLPSTAAVNNDSNSGNKAAAVIILIFILILICFLLSILYFLRKKGRSYSFDLNRVDAIANDYDTPLRSDQQGIRYEQTNKDTPVGLDFIQSEEKDSPMANGSAGDKTQQTPASEDGEEDQNVPEENSFSSSLSFTPPLKKVEFSLDLDLIGGESDLNNESASEAADTPHNENNNNVTNSGRETPEEAFTEISLDELK